MKKTKYHNNNKHKGGVIINNDIVKYHNDLNGISTKNWTAEDINFFFAVISKIRDKGCEEIVISTEEIKELIDYSDRNFRWVKILENIADKIMGLRYIEKTNDEIAYFNMFQRFKINIKNKDISIKVTSDFEYIVNKLTANFTTYELAEFTSLKSVYSKTMYRILKQWRTTGKKEFSLDKLKKVLEVPKTYTNGMINKRIIPQIKKELSQFFDNLKIKTVKENTRGNPITGYIFTWTPEQTSTWDPNKYNYKKPKRKPKIKSKDNYNADGKSYAEIARERRNKRTLELMAKEKGETDV